MKDVTKLEQLVYGIVIINSHINDWKIIYFETLI